MSIPTEKQERFHFLDGLRGIAATMIVIHHSFTSYIVNFFDYLGLGFIGSLITNFTQSGVELFFVLSGIVLLRPYLRKQRKFEVGDYFYRRLKRIYPPYLSSLLLGALIIWIIKAYPSWYSELWKWTEVSFKNILSQAMIISFNASFYNLAWWSLGIEVLFYLLVPLIIFIFPAGDRLNNTKIWTLLLCTLIVSVALQLFLTKFYPDIYNYKHLIINIYQFICYPVCFLLGILLAAKDMTIAKARAFIITGIILIVSSYWYLPIVKPGYGFLYAGFIIFSFNKDSLKRFLSKPVMIWLGERSYSFFLVHFSVFYFTDYLISLFRPGRDIYYGILTRGIGIPLALFIAMLLFTFVEKKYAHGLVTGDIFWPWQVKSLKQFKDK